MKKILFFAATAMLFAACANEEALAPQTAEVAANAISFDTYTASATRAGDAGVMTTDKLKQFEGFGVFSYYHNDADYSTAVRPNFMYNEHVHWVDAWTYAPLKYWPNETIQDSQTGADGAATSTAADKLSFFAYAPYVSTGTGETLGAHGGTDKLNPTWCAAGTGIVALTDETVVGDPKVQWKVSQDPDNNVDLLWGVAPTGGLSYTNVSKTITSVDEGLPLKNLLKPDKDQKIKFLFQHALSRIGLTVVSAIDQIAAGDAAGKFNDAETRVLIKEVKIWGDNIGTNGVLNLNNDTKNRAKWENVTRTASTEAEPLFTINATNGYLNPDLRYIASKIKEINSDASKFTELKTGVLTKEQDLMVGGADPSKKVTAPAFVQGKVFYTLDGSDYVMATTKATEDVDVYTKSGSTYTPVKVKGSGTDYITMSGATPVYYKAELGTKQTSDGTTTILGFGTWQKENVDGTTGFKTYTPYASDGVNAAPAGDYYASITWKELTANDYTGDCYTELTPRYFMVIPSCDDTNAYGSKTTLKVKITYAVITKDEKLVGNLSGVENAITKQTTIQLDNGKAYNLKLILGLTSVKLDAEVADWQVDGSTEVNLPRNNE